MSSEESATEFAEGQSLEIIYADGDIVAVNKPPGLLVHRGWARDEKVAMTMLRDQLGTWVYPIHRLDRGASGVLLFALSPEMASLLGKLFSQRMVAKHYLAIVRGCPIEEQGSIVREIPKKPGGERVPALTHYRRLAKAGRYCLVEASPQTGRLHQIRRHFKHISCPLIGDVKYGKGEHNRHFRENYDLHRLALHSHGMCFVHPLREERVELRAPIAADLFSTFVALGYCQDQEELLADFSVFSEMRAPDSWEE